MTNYLLIFGITAALLAAFTNLGQKGDSRGKSAVSGADWVDVSAPLDPFTTPTYPGDTQPKFEFLRSFDKGEKVTLSSYLMTAHAGTHVDAPLR